MRNLSLFLSTIMGFMSSSTVYACSVCFLNSPESQTTRALSLSIMTLLGCLVLIMGVFIKFLISFHHRAKLHN